MRSNLVNLVYLILIIIPILLVFGMVASSAVNMPFWDEWAMAPLVIKLHTGGLTLNDLWIPHNEHRTLAGRLLLLALAKLGGWDIVKEIYATIVVVILTLVMLWRLMVTTLPPKRLLLLLLAFSCMLFSFVQASNWISGFQIVWPLVNLGVISAVWLTNWRRGDWRTLGLALLGGLVATYSLAGGMAIWPIVFVVMLIQRRDWRIWQIGLWVGVGALAIGAYFYGYVSPNPPGSLLNTFKNPINFGVYVLAYLGAPLAIWTEPLVSAAFALVSLVLTGAAVFWLWRRYRKIGDRSWFNILPWLELIAFAGLNAVITALGRAAQNPLIQALSDRYTTLATLYWLGVLAILYLTLSKLYQQLDLKKQIVLNIVSSALLLVLLVSYVLSAINGYKSANVAFKILKEATFIVYDYPTAPDNLLQTIFPDARYVREYSWVLEQYKEGPFRIPAEEYYQQNEQQWQNKIADYNKVRVIPGQLMTMSFGDATTFIPNNTGASFTHSGKLPVNIMVNTNLANPQVKELLPMSQDWSGQLMDIQSSSNRAYFAQIYWDMGNGLNEVDKEAIYGLTQKDGKHFRLQIPANIKGFRVDVYYINSREKNDKLKINVYSKN